MEFDLSSACDFSASNALMPSGFCTGFLLLSPAGGGDDAIHLVKTDARKHHRSFEFLEIYYKLQCFLGPKFKWCTAISLQWGFFI
jgi:hypothetical protein